MLLTATYLSSLVFRGPSLLLAPAAQCSPGLVGLSPRLAFAMELRSDAGDIFGLFIGSSLLLARERPRLPKELPAAGDAAPDRLFRAAPILPGLVL